MRLARVPGHLLRHRLDGAYYDPSALELDARLRQLGNARRLEFLRDPERPITNGVRGPELIDSSFRLIRLQDCIDWEVRADLALSISGKQFSENARCRLRRDDVVVAIGGYVGNAAIVIDDTAAVIGQHSARVSLAAGGPMNPRFLLAYLNSEPGRVQFARLMRGTVQQGLNLEDVQEIEVPVFSSQAQRNIGDKVRQAERLRQRARELMSVARYLAEEVALGVFDAVSLPRLEHAQAKDRRRGLIAYARESTNRIRLQAPAHLDPTSAFASVDSLRDTYHVNRVKAADLGVRLLAQAHRPDIIAAVNGLKGRGGVRLVTILDGPLSQGLTPEYGSDGLVCIKTRNVVGGLTDLSDSDRVSSRFAAKNAKSTIGRNTVLVNRSGAGSVGRASIYLGDDEVFTNEELFRFRVLHPHDPAYVTLALGTTLGARALEQGVNGSTGQLKLVQEHVEDVLVMLPDSHIQVLVGDLLRLAFECTEGARISVAVARLLVEQLIEGRITEAALIAAQKALEAGDRSADRELLKALRQSNAPDNSKPLIADVEALYSLLDESEDAR